jgi:mannose-P-dolichol utilization defect 1
MENNACVVDFSQGFEFNPDCMGAYAAKLIGMVLLTGAFALKVPQMVNIFMTKDIVGLSPTAFYMEVPLSGIHVVYNYLQGNPFTSFGEQVIILVQNFILVLLLWSYMKPKPSISTVVIVLLTYATIATVSLNLPSEYQYIMPLSLLPMMIHSRLAQIISNYQLGTTGQLSIITTVLQLGGSLARVFTTIVEVGYDVGLLTGCGVSCLLSSTLLFQVIQMIHLQIY